MPDPVFPRYRSAKYDGTNAPELLGLMNILQGQGLNYTLKSSSPTAVVYHNVEFDMDFTVPVNYWLVVDTTNIIGAFTAAEYVSKFADMATLSAGMEPRQCLGVGAVPSLLGNTQATVQVKLEPGFPNMTYSAAAVVTGAASLLAALSVLSTTKVSGVRVDVVVKNTGLLTLAGASVLVAAVAES